jgi:hypothetical protein
MPLIAYLNVPLLLTVGINITVGLLAGWLAARNESSWVRASVSAWLCTVVLLWLWIMILLVSERSMGRPGDWALWDSLMRFFGEVISLVLVVLAIPAALISSISRWVIMQEYRNQSSS